MKTLVKTEKQLNTFRIKNKTSYFSEKVNSPINLIDFKFYQKLFLVLIALSTILIFPESPKESETICQSYHSKQICKVW